jgi:hypothetical protein
MGPITLKEFLFGVINHEQSWKGIPAEIDRIEFHGLFIAFLDCARFVQLVSYVSCGARDPFHRPLVLKRTKRDANGPF